MGPKITVDSATLANKGLELIEAHFLFGVPYERIEVVVHPTSIVHALVRFRDGAALAHLGYPDMSVPISYRAHAIRSGRATDVPQLDLAGGLTLEFEAPDLETFPLLALARRGRRARRHVPVRRTTPRTRSRSRRSSTAGCRSSAIAEVVEEALDAADGCAGARPRRARRGRRRRAPPRRARSAGRVNVFIAILGLGVPDPHPRGRPLLRRPRRRHEPAQVLHRLPAGAREEAAERDRVRHRRDPARGLREDPGDAPPGRGRPRHALRPAPSRSSRSSRRAVERAAAPPRRQSDYDGARARPSHSLGRALEDAAALAAARASPPSAGSPRSATRSARTPTGARRPGSASPSSSPGRARTSSSRSCSSRRSSWPAAARRPASVDEVVAGHARRRQPGCVPATRSSRSTAGRSRPSEIAERDHASATASRSRWSSSGAARPWRSARAAAEAGRRLPARLRPRGRGARPGRVGLAGASASPAS